MQRPRRPAWARRLFLFRRPHRDERPFEVPRVLLKRLRELMAERSSRRSGLDRNRAPDSAEHGCGSVLGLRACAPMACSNFTATEGLNKTAVHLAQLKMGQGLVGTNRRFGAPLKSLRCPVAPGLHLPARDGRRDLSIFPRRSDPAHGPRARCLVVQNKAQRNYREDEVEALETTAMVLAEMVATGELKKITKPGLELDLSAR